MNLKINQRQISCGTDAGCHDAITLSKETVAHYNWGHTDVHCAMVDLSKAYDRINISYLCVKLKATCLPGQIINLIELMGKNTFGCISYEVCLSD